MGMTKKGNKLGYEGREKNGCHNQSNCGDGGQGKLEVKKIKRKKESRQKMITSSMIKNKVQNIILDMRGKKNSGEQRNGWAGCPNMKLEKGVGWAPQKALKSPLGEYHFYS